MIRAGARAITLIGAVLVMAAAEADAEQSGTGQCVGDHEGVVQWTVDANGETVWDTSGCKLREEVRSGVARCRGDWIGEATWTLDENGDEVWDTSGCRRAEKQ